VSPQSLACERCGHGWYVHTAGPCTLCRCVHFSWVSPVSDRPRYGKQPAPPRRGHAVNRTAQQRHWPA